MKFSDLICKSSDCEPFLFNIKMNLKEGGCMV
jgi:hypothetical protein